ncbi:MAG TPA: hypothetical protein VF543_22150 [Pyrinomonadaceae bacterium]|jgi:hypothetical protein
MKILLGVLVLLISSAYSCESSMSSNGNVANNYKASNSSLNSNTDIEQAKQRESETQNQKLRVAPEGFKQIDFKNFSYPYGSQFKITLKNGEQEVEAKLGGESFSFKDVYFADLTNNGEPEAIVILWHVSCGGSCDGGTALFYIYAVPQTKLKLLWQYETGSLAYGCGLKSFTVKNGKITIGLFGRCFKAEDESPAAGKFLIKDETHLTFRFNGRKFVEEEKKYISTSERDVKGYEPEISINE